MRSVPASMFQNKAKTIAITEKSVLKGPKTEKKSLAQAGIEPTAKMVDHCLSTWF